MPVKLNQRAYEHAQRLIEEGRFIHDEREAWSDHHPSTRTENQFIEEKGFFEYGKWFLGVNDDYEDKSRRYYEFAIGNFDNIHRCAVLAAQSRAGQNKHLDVENAATGLLSAIDKQARKKRAQ